MEIDNGSMVADLVSQLGLPERGVALAINQKMVSQQAWKSTALADGDSVLIIKAACGG